MRESTIYDSRQSGESLFKTHAEGGTFDKYYYRKPIENITNELEKNKKIATQSGQHTRDQVLENMQVEATQAQVTLQHDMEVDRLNQKYDMDQWSQFSKAAGELFTMWGEARKERQKDESYLGLSKLRTTDPELFDKYIKNIDAYRAQDGEFKEKIKREAFKALFEANDLVVAETLFSSSHWHEHTIREATLADKIANTTYFYNQYKAKKKFSFPELGIENMTYDEWSSGGASKIKPNLNDPKNQAIDAKFISANIVEVRKNHFIRQDVSPEMIVTKVDPALVKIREDESQDKVAKRKESLKNKNKEGRRLQVKAAIQGSLGQGGDYATQEVYKLVDQDWREFLKPGITKPSKAEEKEARDNSLAHKLEMLLNMHGEREKGINTIQLNQLGKGRVYGGQEPGQHRGMKTGTSKELQELAPEVFARVDFWNRIEQTDMARRGIKTLNQENAQKMVVQAAVDQVQETGKPLSQVEQIEYARAAASRGYGTFQDLYNAIGDAVDTVHGISVEGWVGEILKMKEAKGKLHRSDLPLGVPIEAIRDSRVKGAFYEDPKYHIKVSERRSLQNSLGRSIAGKQGADIKGRPLAPPEYYDAGINAWRKFKTYYDAETGKGTNVTPEAAYETALSKVNADILKDKGEQFMGPIEPLVKFHKTVEANQKILSAGNIDEVQLEGFDDQVKFIKQRWADFKAGGYTGSVMRVFPDHQMMRPSDGSPSVNLFSPEFNSIAITVGGRERLIEGILKQENGKDKPRLKSDYDKTEKRINTYHTPLDPKIYTQLSQGKSPYEGSTWGNLSDTDLSEALGTGDWNPYKARSTWRKFLRGCGIKNSNICTTEMIDAVKERIYRLYGPAAYPSIIFDMESGWSPPQWRVYGGAE